MKNVMNWKLRYDFQRDRVLVCGNVRGDPFHQAEVSQSAGNKEENSVTPQPVCEGRHMIRLIFLAQNTVKTVRADFPSFEIT